MKKISVMLQQGKIKSTIHKTFSFEQMREAHTEVEKGGLVGKVVVLV